MPRHELVEVVRAHVDGSLAPYKRPKQFEVVEALPRTATGKVQRRLVPGLISGLAREAPDRRRCG